MSPKDRLTQWIGRVSGWSLPAKFLASAILSALGGAGILSYLVEYATYTYALAYGFRPPVEGIPYLKTVVTAGSIFLLVSGAVIAASLLVLFRGFISQFQDDRHPLRSQVNRFKTMSGPRATLVVIGFALVLGLFGYFLGPSICSWRPTLECANLSNEHWVFAWGFALSAVTLVFIRLPAAIWWFSAGYTILYYAAVITLIFTPSAYAGFLRFTGFGGGVPVMLQLEETKGSGNPTELLAFLMIRTSNAFIVFDPTKQKFDEYPLEKVYRLSYGSGGMHRLPYQLPEQRGHN